MKKIMDSAGTILGHISDNDEVIMLGGRPDISKDVKRTANNTELTAIGIDKLHSELKTISSDLETERKIRAEADIKSNRIAQLGLTVAIISTIIAFVSLWLSYTGRLPFISPENITEIEAHSEASDTDSYN